MTLVLNHLFADNDARLDGVLSTLRREAQRADRRASRNLADRAIQQVEQLRGRGVGQTPSVDESVNRVISVVSSNYEQYIRLVLRGRFRLSPMCGALEAARNVVEDCRIVRHLLAFHATHAAHVSRNSAILVWALARNFWLKLVAKASSRFPTRRANGFFGADKVDGRNLP